MSLAANSDFHPISCVNNREQAIVTAYLTGEFDARGLPDPPVLSLYFSVVGDKVSQLVIPQNLDMQSIA